MNLTPPTEKENLPRYNRLRKHFKKHLTHYFVFVAICAALLAFYFYYESRMQGNQPRSSQIIYTPKSLDPLDFNYHHKKIPNFLLVVDNKAVRLLTILKSSLNLVVFWSSRCPYCVSQLHNLRQLQSAFSEQDLKVILVCIDLGAPDQIELILQQNNAGGMPLYYTGDNPLPASLDIWGLPLAILVDGHGMELWRKAGQVPWDNMDVTKHINIILE